MAATPGRASFAGLSNRPNGSPSFRDIARMLIAPSEKLKGFIELERALVAALLIVAFILITLYAVIIVFMPYLRTLLLALLFGSFLHPMKRSLSQFFKQILNEIRQDRVPMLAGLITPFFIVDRIVEWLRLIFCHYVIEVVNFGRTIVNRDFKSALTVCIAAMALVIIGGNLIINIVMSINLIIFVSDTSNTDVSFSDASLHFLIRSFVLAQLCWLQAQIVYLLVLIIVTWIGLSRIFSHLRNRFYLSIGLEDQKREEKRQERRQEKERIKQKQLSEDLSFDETGSDHDKSVPVNDNQDRDLSFESPLIRSYRSLNSIYDLFIEQVEGYVDTISSACVIGIVAVIVTLTTLYLSVQIYSETIHLIEKVGMAANALHRSNPELQSWLPDLLDIIHSLLDGAVKNTYQHGREWIRNSTRQLLNNAATDEFNTTQSALIEKQMVEFWDRAYELWLKNRQTIALNSTQDVASFKSHDRPYDWGRLYDAFQTLNFSLCAKIFKQNWDTLVSVTDSVIIVLKGNISLVLGFVTATLSLLIGGGNVIMNFIIDLIIFTTALFYLLCASEDQYKPIELVKSLMPRSEATIVMKARGQRNKSEAIHSVDESINAVFTASLKMMAFHGLSTWLLHRLFELEVVYIPSVISALFGAVPFISPYWASIPACFDLWLSGQASQAILMLILATLPSSWLTTSFYSEIKGAGHPYLTGLAIAGGVLVFGIEGALFGPLLLVTVRLLSLVVVYLMDSFK